VYDQLKRLARHSAIYGLGGLVSRILAVLLLPLYTAYLHDEDYGAIEVLLAGSAILVTLLRAGISSAFFRYYFDAGDDEGRLLIVRTSFWFTLTSATVGLLAGLALAEPISDALFAEDRTDLVRAAFVGLWAQMNYEQLTALFRVEERSTGFVAASLTNVLITVAATVLLVVVLEQGALGVLVGNFTGTLVVYATLLAYRREQLGLQFSRSLLRDMNRFGLPLVPSALALWVLNFSDRFFLNGLASTDDVGVYSIAVRIASALMLLLVAFRMAWPAFAYSIEDDDEARRTYSFVLTYLLFVACWGAVVLGLLSPWLVRLLTSRDEYLGASPLVAPLAFAAAAYAGYIVVSIGVGRAKRTQFNWVVTGFAAAVNAALNLILVPRYGTSGAAAATVAAFTVMFVGMTANSQRVFPVPYQWRRVVTLVAAAVGLVVLGKALDVPLSLALALGLSYPLVLAVLGFYLPAERARLRRLYATTR
jgi:O-antigen/teichoic acid export membrane protein